MAKKEGEINEYFMGIFMILGLIALVIGFFVMIFGETEYRSVDHEPLAEEQYQDRY